MTNKVKILSLGGLDENGKNLYILEINDDILVFEAGMKFPEIKALGIDMIIPDTTYLEENKNRVKAYFISHGHDDIMGALPYIIQKVPAPVYCSVATQYMIETTAKRFHQNPNIDYRIVDSGDVVNISGHETTFFATTHSARNSLGIAVETGDGLVIYTGDFIFDYEPLNQYRTDVNLLGKLAEKKVLALMTESISCDKEGHTSPNHKLKPVIEPIFSESNGRIFVSIYYQNVYGIREIIDLAVKYNRKFYVYGDEIKAMLRDTFDKDLTAILNTIIISDNQLARIKDSELCVLIGGQGDTVFKQLLRMADKEDNLFQFKESDNVIVASPSVPGLEVFSTKVIDELYKTGAHITNIKSKQVCSMHAHAEDIKMMLSILKPKYYIPVKGEFKNLYSNAMIAMNMNIGYNNFNVFVYDNGMPILFEDGNFKGSGETIELHEVMIDGLGVGDVGSSVVNDRTLLAEEGVLVMGICIDSSKNEIIAGPDAQLRGVISLRDGDDLLKELIPTFDSMVMDEMKKGKINTDEARNRIHDKLVAIVRKYTGKDPLVLPVISDLNKK